MMDVPGGPVNAEAAAGLLPDVPPGPAGSRRSRRGNRGHVSPPWGTGWMIYNYSRNDSFELREEQ